MEFGLGIGSMVGKDSQYGAYEGSGVRGREVSGRANGRRRHFSPKFPTDPGDIIDGDILHVSYNVALIHHFLIYFDY